MARSSKGDCCHSFVWCGCLRLLVGLLREVESWLSSGDCACVLNGGPEIAADDDPERTQCGEVPRRVIRRAFRGFAIGLFIAAAIASALLLQGIYEAEILRDNALNLHRRSRDVIMPEMPPVNSGGCLVTVGAVRLVAGRWK